MRRIAAFAGVVAILVATAPGVAAEPPEPPPPPAPGGERVQPPATGGGAILESPTLSLSELGTSTTLAFYVNRDITSTNLTFPVPTGLNPVMLKAGIELPVNLRFGNLTVSQGGRTISRVPLPAPDQPQVMEIPLAGTEVSGNWVNVTLTMTAVPIDNYCWDPVAPIRLVNGSIVFAGSERPPTTVAEFLPPVLSKVTIAVPARPSQPESEAAIQVAAAVASRNGQQPEVVVVPLPDGADTLPGRSAPMERQIVVKEGPRKGLFLQGGPGVQSLLISGPGNELPGQARLLDDDALRLAVSSGSAVDSLPEQQLADDKTTLELLKGGGLSSEAMWPRISIDIDQTRWGHPLSGVSVHLIGSYTPLPENFGGEVIVSVGSETIDRWPASGDGTIDRTVQIPDRLLKRYTGLDLAVRTTGNPGHCGDHLPMLLRLDGATGVTVQRANPPVPQGFQSLPQALQPRIRIGIGSDAFADTARAAQIVVGLQRASRVQLQMEVTELQAALASDEPAILISADGWTDTELALPFSVDGGKLTVSGLDPQGESATLELDPATPFGSLQTVFDGKRTVLIATSTGEPRLLDDLLRFLASDPGRWAGLAGRAIVSAPGAQPITIPNPPYDYAAQSRAAEGGDQEGDWFWWAVGGVAAVAAIGALAILMRARRS